MISQKILKIKIKKSKMLGSDNEKWNHYQK